MSPTTIPQGAPVVNGLGPHQRRLVAGVQIAATPSQVSVVEEGASYRVRSQSDETTRYTVGMGEAWWVCECPDGANRGQCKHCWATNLVDSAIMAGRAAEAEGVPPYALADEILVALQQDLSEYLSFIAPYLNAIALRAAAYVTARPIAALDMAA